MQSYVRMKRPLLQASSTCYCNLRQRSRVAATLAATVGFDTGQRRRTSTVEDDALTEPIHRHNVRLYNTGNVCEDSNNRRAQCLDNSLLASINESTIEGRPFDTAAPPPGVEGLRRKVILTFPT